MRFIQVLLAWIVPIASAHILEPGEINKTLVPEKEFLIETAPGKTQWASLEDKWELRRVSACLLLACYSLTSQPSHPSHHILHLINFLDSRHDLSRSIHLHRSAPVAPGLQPAAACTHILILAPPCIRMGQGSWTSLRLKIWAP